MEEKLRSEASYALRLPSLKVEGFRGIEHLEICRLGSCDVADWR